jgi:hypothetical protein
MPQLTPSEPARLIYPEDGLASGYYHHHPDPVVPVSWRIDEIAPSVERAIALYDSKYTASPSQSGSKGRVWRDGRFRICRITWSRGRELNPRPTDYESVAPPLSYPGFSGSYVRDEVDFTTVVPILG